MGRQGSIHPDSASTVGAPCAGAASRMRNKETPAPAKSHPPPPTISGPIISTCFSVTPHPTPSHPASSHPAPSVYWRYKKDSSLGRLPPPSPRYRRKYPDQPDNDSGHPGVVHVGREGFREQVLFPGELEDDEALDGKQTLSPNYSRDC